MNILVAGGAGYIGSHLVRACRAAGHAVLVADNLSAGHRQAVGETPLVATDVHDTAALAELMRRARTDAVVHLAAHIEAGESVVKPEKYFRNNTCGTLSLLEAMRQAGVGRLVFSSTAAVYGSPRRVPIGEDDPTDPINPYGASKLASEYILRAYAQAHGVGSVALRYFNVAGADPAGNIGEDHHPETHLIPLVLAVALGRRPSIKIFGSDYDTPDGTCIRDYIHVADLAAAHLLALGAVRPGHFRAYNLGNGAGFSVWEVIETCRRVTGQAIPAERAHRREGDPPRLVAAADRARADLGWQPRFPALQAIIEHAWAWHRTHPEGYRP